MSRSQISAVCCSTRVVTPSARAHAAAVAANQLQKNAAHCTALSQPTTQLLLGPLGGENDDDDGDFVASTVASSPMSFLAPTDEQQVTNAEVGFLLCCVYLF